MTEHSSEKPNGASARRREASDAMRLDAAGRRHLYAPYVLPKDLGEANRLDAQHYMLRYALQGNFSAPLDEPEHILDVGCGTGRWLHEMADAFPTATVVGVDLVELDSAAGSGVLRSDKYVFSRGNVLQGLPLADRTFDFTHQRLLSAAIPLRYWPGVVRELVRVTVPGGWVELVESSMPENIGPARRHSAEWANELCMRRGIQLDVTKLLPGWLHDAGVESVTVRRVDIPVGPHGGHLGLLAAEDLVAAREGLRALLLSEGIATAEEYDEVAANTPDEIAHGKCIWPFFIVYGQRPG